MTTFTPTTPAETLAAVSWAVSEEAPLEIVGHGSKRGLGRSVQAANTLDLSRLSGGTLYEPGGLVMSAQAGTPLAEIEALLAANNQELAFEPMDYAHLHGAAPGRGTIGGVFSCNLSGPRRLKAGAARDHILGVEIVTGRGDIVKSGGRVVKNVTGYDLSKLMCGAYGTLGALTQVTFKVLPRAETEETFVLRGLSDADAAAVMATAMGSSADVSSAAHLPETVCGKVADGALSGEAATALRLEGFGPSVAARRDTLHRLFPAGRIDVLDEATSRKLWRDIRDCASFAGAETPAWGVSLPPMRGPAYVMDLRMQTAAGAFYDWQGGLVWLAMLDGPQAETVRGLVARHGGGHATLGRASSSIRNATPPFHPQPPALAALSKRLKEEFDPKGMLNPGRLMAGV